jgi:signal transduction histidine kinase
MRRTLYGKLALALLGVLLAVGALFWVAGLRSAQHFLSEVQQKLHRDLAEHLVAESLPLENGEVLGENLEHIFHVLMVINPSIEVYLLDSEGVILAFSAPEGVVVRQRVELEPIRQFLRSEARLPIFGDDPRSAEGRKVFSAAALGSSREPEGFLYVVLAGQQWDSAIAMLRGSYMLRLGAATTAAGLGVVLIAGLLAFGWITRRTRLLEQAMTRFRDSGFRQHDTVGPSHRPPRDEIDSLALTFDAMAARLVAQLEEIEKTDRLRRELVANISHDLRTPLTSLRGFLETLNLKHASLPEDERRRYLEAAIRQTERLNRLVTDLFELARLESGTRELEIEPLALAELAQDAVQQFRLAAADRGVEVEARTPAGAATVDGDMGLLARVLDNLIDNGVRHTPPGGRVTIELRETPQWVTLQVSDTGCGIAPEDLPHVFDRFFHRERDGAQSEGAGLGLAIARRIVELHGGTIRADSSPGQGTIFAVALPAHGAAM